MHKSFLPLQIELIVSDLNLPSLKLKMRYAAQN